MVSFAWLLAVFAFDCTSGVQAPPDGTYLLRLVLIRHGFSCANVPWNACTNNASKLTPSGMGPSAYHKTMAMLDSLMRKDEPVSMEGIDYAWGIRPRSWKILGKSKTIDGLSDDCLVKANKKSLVNDEYDGHGNLIAIRQLVRDPFITACDRQRALVARDVLAGWFRTNIQQLDLVASSSLKRAIETADLVLLNQSAAAGIHDVTILPYINEKNAETPYQPENFPNNASIQAEQIEAELGPIQLQENLTKRGGYPRRDQQFDKFKVVLALEVLPRLMQRRKGSKSITWEPNAMLVDALEAGRAAGHPVIPVTSSPNQMRNNPLHNLKAGSLQYIHGRQIDATEYETAKHNGAPEFVLGIGSHGNLLSDYCLGGGHANNFDTFEKLIQVNVSTLANGEQTFTVSEVEGQCRQIMAAPDAPAPGTLTSSDLGSACTSPFDIRPFMDLALESQHGKSLCMSQAMSGPFHLVTQPDVGATLLRSGRMIPGHVLSLRLQCAAVLVLAAAGVCIGAECWRRYHRMAKDLNKRVPLLGTSGDGA